MTRTSSMRRIGYDLDIATRKRARNSKIAVVSILLVYTLDVKFNGINLAGQTSVQFQSSENMYLWLWIFFVFFAFRFIQSFIHFKKSGDNWLLFEKKTYNENWIKWFYPKTFDEAWIDGKLVKGQFKFRRIGKGNSKNFDSHYFIQGDIQYKTESGSRKETVYSIPLNEKKYKLLKALIYFPCMVGSMLRNPDYLTVMIPFLGYIILFAFMVHRYWPSFVGCVE